MATYSGAIMDSIEIADRLGIAPGRLHYWIAKGHITSRADWDADSAVALLLAHDLENAGIPASVIRHATDAAPNGKPDDAIVVEIHGALRDAMFRVRFLSNGGQPSDDCTSIMTPIASLRSRVAAAMK